MATIAISPESVTIAHAARSIDLGNAVMVSSNVKDEPRR
jgi:hypothetical protein